MLFSCKGFCKASCKVSCKGTGRKTVHFFPVYGTRFAQATLVGALAQRKTPARWPKYRVRAVPLHLKQANEFVAQHHRHSLPTVGGKFAVGVADDTGKVVGVAIAGRPVSRRLDDGLTLEVLRVCTDGTANACSFLYARAAKIGRLMGYQRVVTYTLASEGGASLRAVGAVPTGPLESHEWGNPNRPRKSQHVYHEQKFRWEL